MLGSSGMLGACALAVGACGAGEPTQVSQAWHRFATNVNTAIAWQNPPASGEPTSGKILHLPNPATVQREIEQLHLYLPSQARPDFDPGLLNQRFLVQIPTPPTSPAAARELSTRGCAQLQQEESAHTCADALAARFSAPAQKLDPSLGAIRIFGSTATGRAGSLAVTFVRAGSRWVLASAPAG